MGEIYTNEDHKKLMKNIEAWLDQFDKSCEEFEGEFGDNAKEIQEDFGEEIRSLQEQLKECREPKTWTGKIKFVDFNESVDDMIDNAFYNYKLDDYEKEMVEELAKKMNCTWQYVMTEAIEQLYERVVVWRQADVNESTEEVEEEHDMVNRPSHYTAHNVETIEKIERFINGLPSKEAHLIGCALKYFDRAGLKDDFEQDCNKGNNYLHRAVTGKWKYAN